MSALLKLFRGMKKPWEVRARARGGGRLRRAGRRAARAAPRPLLLCTRRCTRRIAAHLSPPCPLAP